MKKLVTGLWASLAKRTRRVLEAFSADEEKVVDLDAVAERFSSVRVRPTQERRHQPFDDTWRSWDPEALEKTRLFNETGNPDKTNMLGCGGQFPSDQTFRIQGIGVHVEASELGLKEIVTRGTTLEFIVMDKIVQTLRAEYLADRGGNVVIARSIKLPPRQYFEVSLAFSGEAREALEKVATRVGPGAGWVSIRVTLDGMHMRDVL